MNTNAEMMALISDMKTPRDGLDTSDDSIGLSFPEEAELDSSTDPDQSMEEFKVVTTEASEIPHTNEPTVPPLPLLRLEDSKGSTLSSIFAGRSSDRRLSGISH
jgi:hypothetical protein